MVNPFVLISPEGGACCTLKGAVDSAEYKLREGKNSLLIPVWLEPEIRRWPRADPE